MTRAKIIGAGSIGNHLTHAARTLGWQVDLCDIDPAALERAKTTIYPERYGMWDDSIGLHIADQAPKGGYDFIIVGTPPDFHIEVAMQAVEERPRLILIEKPVCSPSLEGVEDLLVAAEANGVALAVGYDLLLGAAFNRAVELLETLPIGPIVTLDVEIREHWGGIFAAHPWLDGPRESYLGFWKRGGGAAGEHSHGLNMWQHLAHVLGGGRVIEVDAKMTYDHTDGVNCDKICLADLRTETGLAGRVVPDVVTKPARKRARVQGCDGYVEWTYGAAPGEHMVAYSFGDREKVEERIFASRPDDFIQELEHLESALANGWDHSPITVHRGLDTMLVIAAAHRSAEFQSSVCIDFTKGYRLEALSPIAGAAA